MKNKHSAFRNPQSAFAIVSVYQFVAFPDYRDHRQPLLALCRRHELKGTILLAPEGINGTVAGARDGLEALLERLRADERFPSLEVKWSSASDMPFDRMKVRVRQELISLGDPAADPTRRAGTYVEPEAWNRLITDPDVVLIDTRNEYEVRIGTFEGAVNPNTASFQQFPAFVDAHLDPNEHRRVAMFCTGGIRCEKASAYLLNQGFETVYHLHGGILRYLETVPEEESLWEGECFVFDQRVSVAHGLKPGTHVMCRACGEPVSESEQTAPEYEPGVSCPQCFDRTTEEDKSRFRERERRQAAH